MPLSHIGLVNLAGIKLLKQKGIKVLTYIFSVLFVMTLPLLAIGGGFLLPILFGICIIAMALVTLPVCIIAILLKDSKSKQKIQFVSLSARERMVNAQNVILLRQQNKDTQSSEFGHYYKSKKVSIK